MFEIKICRICLDNNVRLHQISGSEVQDIYEKITNKVQEEGNLYFACYICYCQLKNCQQIAMKSQKSKALLSQILPISSENHLRRIRFLDRLTHGLVHSLAVTDIESLQIPEYNEFIKTDKQVESDANEEIVQDGSDVKFNNVSPTPKEIKLGEILNTKHGDFSSIDSGKKKNILKFETNTAPYSKNLFRIVNNEKSEQVLVKKTYICNNCGKTCETKAVLIKHISGHKPVTIQPNETNIKKWKSLCEKKYKSEIKENDSSNKNLPYKCKYCNYTCAYNSNLKNHIRTHAGETLFKCQFCNYRCTRNSILKIHIRTHTGEKPFKCQYCSYTCAHGGQLKRHIRTHTGEKPFKCHNCNYTCTISNNLKTHIRTHTGEKPFKCHFCNYTCAHNSVLRIHIRTHTQEKPFKCQYCSYTCAHGSSLKRHIRTHTREKPFKCQYCSYTCTDAGHLKRHIRTHTGEKPFKCQYCNYTCTVSNNLKRHIRTHSR